MRVPCFQHEDRLTRHTCAQKLLLYINYSASGITNLEFLNVFTNSCHCNISIEIFNAQIHASNTLNSFSSFRLMFNIGAHCPASG